MLGFGSGSAPSNPAGGASASDKTNPKTPGSTTGGKTKTAKLGLGASVSDLLVTPSADAVDFRAACFCHRNVVDTGFVCSVCLSIFCEVPEGGECLTCGTALALGQYGKRPVVTHPRNTGGGGGSPNAGRKEKRKLGVDGEV
jgi:transcription initiation factor TFIIH subunit 3